MFGLVWFNQNWSHISKFSLQDVIQVGLSDQQQLRIKRGTQKQIRCRSLINYLVDIYGEALGR